jgi:hypothetical protein
MSALAFRSTAAPSVIDIDIVRLVLDVRGRTARNLDARVQNSITDGELERTTDGASTLRVTLHDPDRALASLTEARVETPASATTALALCAPCSRPEGLACDPVGLRRLRGF